MNYGFRKVLVPCSPHSFPPSISVSFFKISARAQPEARSYKYRTCFPQSISVSFFKISARAQPEARSYKFSFHFRCKVNAFPPHSI